MRSTPAAITLLPNDHRPIRFFAFAQHQRCFVYRKPSHRPFTRLRTPVLFMKVSIYLKPLFILFLAALQSQWTSTVLLRIIFPLMYPFQHYAGALAKAPSPDPHPPPPSTNWTYSRPTRGETSSQQKALLHAALTHRTPTFIPISSSHEPKRTCYKDGRSERQEFEKARALCC